MFVLRQGRFKPFEHIFVSEDINLSMSNAFVKDPSRYGVLLLFYSIVLYSIYVCTTMHLILEGKALTRFLHIASEFYNSQQHTQATRRVATRREAKPYRSLFLSFYYYIITIFLHGHVLFYRRFTIEFYTIYDFNKLSHFSFSYLHKNFISSFCIDIRTKETRRKFLNRLSGSVG